MAVTSSSWPKATRCPATLSAKSFALRSSLKPIRTAFDRRRSPQTFTVTGPAASSVARVPSLMFSNRYVPGASSMSTSLFANSEPYAPGPRLVGPPGSTKAPNGDPAQVNGGSSGGAAKRGARRGGLGRGAWGGGGQGRGGGGGKETPAVPQSPSASTMRTAQTARGMPANKNAKRPKRHAAPPFRAELQAPRECPHP